MSEGRQFHRVYRGSAESSLQISPSKSVTLMHLKFVSYCEGETPDQTPVAIPVDDAEETLDERVKRLIATELSRHAAEQGEGTLEDENDFDVEDEEEMYSPYEMVEMAEEPAPEPVEAPPAPEATSTPETPEAPPEPPEIPATG